MWKKAIGTTVVTTLLLAAAGSAQAQIVEDASEPLPEDDRVDDALFEALVVELGGLVYAEADCSASGSACAIGCPDGSCCAMGADACPEGTVPYCGCQDGSAVCTCKPYRSDDVEKVASATTAFNLKR